MKRTFIAAAAIGLSMVLQADDQGTYQKQTGTTEAAPSQQSGVNAELKEPAGAQQTNGAATSASGTVAGVRTTPYIGPKLNELPAAVQNTIKEHAMGQPIEDIDRDTWNDRVVYEVEFEQEGKNREIHVAEDGSLVNLNEAAGAEPGASTNKVDVNVPAVP